MTEAERERTACFCQRVLALGDRLELSDLDRCRLERWAQGDGSMELAAEFLDQRLDEWLQQIEDTQ